MTEKPRVFYSWQSDCPANLNHYFIRDCLKVAISKVNLEIDESLRFDSDTQDIAGTPDIPKVLFEKIASSAVFVGDVSFVASNSTGKNVSNPNVLLELGYASSMISWERTILVQNTFFGGPEMLPFDLTHRRFPITYALVPAETQKGAVRQQLVADLMTALKACLEEEHGFVLRTIQKLDRDCLALLHQVSKSEYFADDENQHRWAIGRLLELGVIYTHPDFPNSKYAYHWTYLGSLVRDKANEGR